MRCAHPIIVLLVAASLLINACTWIMTAGSNWPGIPGLVLLTMAVSQTNLVAVWTVLGPGKWWVRLSVLAAVAATLAWLIQTANPAAKPQSIPLLALEFEAMLVVAGLSLVRLSGQQFQSRG